jgi:hypothetical protein
MDKRVCDYFPSGWAELCDGTQVRYEPHELKFKYEDVVMYLEMDAFDELVRLVNGARAADSASSAR